MAYTTIPLGQLRRSDGLYTLVVHRPQRDPGDREESYREELIAAAPSVATEAWDRLAAVKEIEPRVREDVFTVLAHTVMDPEGDAPVLPALEIAPPPRPHKPTAANPRAYKGTKDRPPKPRRPEAMDLRPFLCSAAGQERLLAALTAELGPVEPPDEWRAAPPLCRRYFGGAPAESRKAVLAAWHALELSREPQLRLALAKAFLIPDWTPHWVELLQQLPPERRLTMVDILWKEPSDFDCVPETIPHLVAFDRRLGAEEFAAQMHYAVHRCWWHGDSVTDLLATQELLFAHSREFPFENGDPVPPRAAVDALSRFAEAIAELNYPLSAEFLVVAGHLPRIAEVLDLISASPVTARTKYVMAEGFAYLHKEDAPEYELAQGLAALPDALRALAGVPADYQPKGAEIFREYLYETTTEDLAMAVQLIERVCREPFSKDGSFYMLAEELAWLDDELWPEVLAAEDAAFAVLEDWTRRDNEALLVCRGFDTLIDELDRLTVDGIVAAPAVLCRTARVYGVMSSAARETLAASFETCELMQDREFDAMSAAGLLGWLVEHAGSAADGYVPQKLRRFVAGEYELKPGQVERHLEQVRRAVPAIRLKALEARILQQLSAGLPGDEDLSDAMTHAVMMQAGLDENRRVMRRTLSAVFDGNFDYLRNHPDNAAWLQQHPDLDVALWTGGFAREYEHDGATIQLAVVADPLEALRMGTYVGSCYGLGGKFTDAAAATVLDINKQVVFARGDKQQFLARQVYAIDDQGQLCCFDIYPEVGVDLQRVFARFAREFAAALDLEIAVAGEDNRFPEIAKTLSQYWWHDGIWELEEEAS